MVKIFAEDRFGRVHALECKDDLTLMELLKSHEFGVTGECGGAASCGTCHIYLDPSWSKTVTQPELQEASLVGCLPGNTENSRLACQIRIMSLLDGLKVAIAPA